MSRVSGPPQTGANKRCTQRIVTRKGAPPNNNNTSEQLHTTSGYMFVQRDWFKDK